MDKYLFEDFLKEVHAQQYTGLDDEMSDDFDNWVTELDGEELIAYGNVALHFTREQAKAEALQEIREGRELA